MLPNLIIPGAPKAGTSSLAKYLAQHPDIYVSRYKEPRFFISDVINNLPASDPLKKYLMEESVLDAARYAAIYESGARYIYRVDASVQYLYYYQSVIPKLVAQLGDPSILICLRNPVDRAFSNYCYMNSKMSFEEELHLESWKIQEGFNSFALYLGQGFYYAQVKAYIDAFSKVKIILFDDLVKRTKDVVNDVLDFLELGTDTIIDTTTAHNESTEPKNRFVEMLVLRENLLKKVARPIATAILGKSGREKLGLAVHAISVQKSQKQLEPEVRVRLAATYRDDILRLQDLIGIDLSVWLN